MGRRASAGSGEGWDFRVLDGLRTPRTVRLRPETQRMRGVLFVLTAFGIVSASAGTAVRCQACVADGDDERKNGPVRESRK
jgi:hypothetical protein